MLKAIFFDIDNTLYDSKTLSSMARRNSILAMIDAGLPVSFDKAMEKLEEVIKKYGANYPHHYDRLLEELGVKSYKMVAAGVVAYERTKFGYLRPYPEVVPTLLKLREKYKLGVISNGLAVKQWEKLIGLGLHHFFSAIITSQEYGAEKPAKEIFSHALKSIAAKANEAVMVGDKDKEDIEAARKAGMHAIDIKKLERFSGIIKEIERINKK